MSNYEFRDVPINRRAMRQLIIELFSHGKAQERRQIINTCEATHLSRGGIKPKNKLVGIGAFKSAMNDLRKLGLAERAAHRSYWRVIMPAGSNRDERTLNKLVLFVRQMGICNGCEKDFDFGNLTVDHKIPDGNNDMDNLQLLCGRCNSVKGNRTHAYLLARLRRDGIVS